MALSGSVVANDVPEHREVLGDAGAYYARNDEAALAARLRDLLEAPAERERLASKARAVVTERFSWESVTDSYERLSLALAPPRRSPE